MKVGFGNVKKSQTETNLQGCFDVYGVISNGLPKYSAGKLGLGSVSPPLPICLVDGLVSLVTVVLLSGIPLGEALP